MDLKPFPLCFLFLPQICIRDQNRLFVNFIFSGTFLFLLGRQYFHPKHKIINMANPNHGQQNAGTPDSGTRHHKKAKAHKQSYRDHNTKFRPCRHSFLFYKRIQVFPIHLGADKPIMQFLRRFCKEKHRSQEKRHCWQDGKGDSYTPQAQAHTT